MEKEKTTQNQTSHKTDVVCSACGNGCEENGFSPIGTVEWFCSQECYDSYFEDMYDDHFQCCADCDVPDACRDFGCAIKAGIVKRIY